MPLNAVGQEVLHAGVRKHGAHVLRLSENLLRDNLRSK